MGQLLNSWSLAGVAILFEALKTSQLNLAIIVLPVVSINRNKDILVIKVQAEIHKVLPLHFHVLAKSFIEKLSKTIEHKICSSLQKWATI